MKLVWFFVSKWFVYVKCRISLKLRNSHLNSLWFLVAKLFVISQLQNKSWIAKQSLETLSYLRTIKCRKNRALRNNQCKVHRCFVRKLSMWPVKFRICHGLKIVSVCHFDILYETYFWPVKCIICRRLRKSTPVKCWIRNGIRNSYIWFTLWFFVSKLFIISQIQNMWNVLKYEIACFMNKISSI